MSEEKSVLDKILDWWERFGCSFSLGMACASSMCFVGNIYENDYPFVVLDVLLMAYWIWECNHQYNLMRENYLYVKDRNEFLNTIIEMKQDILHNEQCLNRQLCDDVKYWMNKANKK